MAGQLKDQKCSQCGEMFTKKGLDGHIAFKHGGARGSNNAPEAKVAAKPPAAGAERKSSAGSVSDATGDSSGVDKFLFG